MPTNNKLSLNNRGAIFALRIEGYSPCEIGCKLVIKIRAEKIAWKNLISIPPEYLNSLYKSMPGEMQAMVDAQGGHTKCLTIFGLFSSHTRH